jgi:hypothetical protein
MQSSRLRHDLLARLQVQMIGVGKYHLGTSGLELIWRDGFDIRQRPHWHESRCLNYTVGRHKQTSPSLSTATLSLTLKSKLSAQDKFNLESEQMLYGKNGGKGYSGLRMNQSRATLQHKR